MPAQKRSPETTQEDDTPQHNHSNSNHEQPEHADESDRSNSSSNGEKDEFVVVKLSDLRKEVQCPICLGIIRKTRTVMECLHRFCRECIDKSMRLGNNECPACRTHCASRRSLRDDPNYDALIAALYPDIDKYELEESTFHEEERTRNEQIQASIAQTIRRQSEALGRKRTSAKATAAAFVRRSQGNYRNPHLRGRRNHQSPDLNGYDENEDTNGNNGGKDLSSADELSAEVKPKRRKRWEGAQFSQHSQAASSADRGGDENDSEVNRETLGASAALVGSAERLAWGKGGMRSHTRYGSVTGGNGKIARNSRLSKLVDYFKNLEENELDIHLVLMSSDETRIPKLQRPYLCCRPTLAVRHLCQYIALQTAFHADEVEIFFVKELPTKLSPLSILISNSNIIDLCKDNWRVLGEQDTLAGVQTMHSFGHGLLLLAYQKKMGNSKEVQTTNSPLALS